MPPAGPPPSLLRIQRLGGRSESSQVQFESLISPGIHSIAMDKASGMGSLGSFGGPGPMPDSPKLAGIR